MKKGNVGPGLFGYGSMGRKKAFLTLFLIVTLWVSDLTVVFAEVSVTSPSAVLIESSTGQIIYEKEATFRRSPASITKIMTLLLTFEALDQGKIKLEDEVMTSDYASSMGGSQVFLESGEVQSLETMIKCIVVASGNDASVAVAEHIAGSEQAFVEKMNEKATKLGMENTHFVDCCGLTDSEDHYSCALDVAVMSRELTVAYPKIFDYTKIWMEDIVHETRRGSSVFTLSSTNKLLKQYQYATGLKTGFTRKAGYCLSATASKDGIDLIAVVMGAEDTKIRMKDIQTLLTYGFGCCKLYVDDKEEQLPALCVEGGVKEFAQLEYESSFRYLDTRGNQLEGIKKVIDLPPSCRAPVVAGANVGKLRYYLDDKEIGNVGIVFAESVEKATYLDYLKDVFIILLL